MTSPGGYVVCGSTDRGSRRDVYLLKTAADTWGIQEEKTIVKNNHLGPTILSGPLVLPNDKTCRVFDITGRVVAPDKIKPGIDFIEIEGEATQKVIKIK